MLYTCTKGLQGHRSDQSCQFRMTDCLIIDTLLCVIATTLFRLCIPIGMIGIILPAQKHSPRIFGNDRWFCNGISSFQPTMSFSAQRRIIPEIEGQSASKPTHAQMMPNVIIAVTEPSVVKSKNSLRSQIGDLILK